MIRGNCNVEPVWSLNIKIMQLFNEASLLLSGKTGLYKTFAFYLFLYYNYNYLLRIIQTPSRATLTGNPQLSHFLFFFPQSVISGHGATYRVADKITVWSLKHLHLQIRSHFGTGSSVLVFRAFAGRSSIMF